MRIRYIKNTQFSGYYFYMNLKNTGRFSNLLSIPLRKREGARSLLVYQLINTGQQKLALVLFVEMKRIIL